MKPLQLSGRAIFNHNGRPPCLPASGTRSRPTKKSAATASLARMLVAIVVCFVSGLATARAATSLPHAQVAQSYSYTITTTPAAPAGTVYSATGLPGGISINSSSGVISGTPTTAGTYSGVISLTLNSVTNNLDYSLVVDAAAGAPAITSATSASATVGQAFDYLVEADHSPTSFNVGTLPAGLSFDSGTHHISGSPSAAGTYQVSLSANNASGTGATTTLTISVSPAGAVPEITSAATASGSLVPSSDPASFTVSYQIEATESPASYSATGLPLGLALDSTTGLISGTTTIQGVYDVALSATNNNGTGPTKTLTLTIGSLSEITSASTLNLTVNQAMTPLQLTASNSPESFNVTGLPPGLTFNTSTNRISGTPTATGSTTVNLSANNAVGAGPSATLTITVAAASGGGGGGGGGGGSSATPPAITSPTTATAVLNEAFTYTIKATPAATSFAATDLPDGITLDTTSGVVSGKFAAVGSYTITLTATNGDGSGFRTLVVTVNSRPTITAQPQGAALAIGASTTLSVTATSSPAPTYQWRQNGLAITGAVGPALTLSNVQPADAGAYTVALTNITGTVVSDAAIIGIVSTAKVAGAGEVVDHDIVHPNGNIYDQILLTGAAATFTADAQKITRLSFIDLDDDIVQVELSGAGSVTLTLENATGPAAPAKYNQPDVLYMKGHASLVVTGADETTNVTVFSVGKITAVNQTLFKDDETYDGMADIGLLSITSTNGKFGGIRAGNAHFFRATGATGIDARGVAIQGPTYVGNLTADADATPVLLFGSTTDIRITGGDLLQLNDRPVQVDGITQLKFTAGQDSHGHELPARTNKAKLEQNGTDVTATIVVNP